MLSKETVHLLKWQWIWAYRFWKTTWHIINRKAYHKWKNSRKGYSYDMPILDLDETLNQDLYH